MRAVHGLNEKKRPPSLAAGEAYIRFLKVDMSGELPITRSGTGAADSAEAVRRCVVPRCAGALHRRFIPDVDAICLKNEGPEVFRQWEAAMERGIQVLRARVPQVERLRARSVPDQPDGTVGLGVLELRVIDIEDGLAAGDQAKIAGGGPARPCSI